MSFFDSIFGGGEDPAGAAKPFYDQVGPTVKPLYDPYVNAGTGNLQLLQEQIKRLLTNPNDLQDQIGKGYKQSPGYQFQVDEATKAAERAASAGGYLGTPQHETELAERIRGIASQDYNEYVNKGLNTYGQGFGGANNVTNTGYDASKSLAGDLAASLMNQGNLAYSAAQQKNNNSLDLFKGLGTLAGTVLGGPIGGALANKFLPGSKAA